MLLIDPKLLGARRPSVVTRSMKLRAAAGPHGGIPVTAVHVAVAQDPAGNLKPVKDKSIEAATGDYIRMPLTAAISA
jgi:hypothetical protein